MGGVRFRPFSFSTSASTLARGKGETLDGVFDTELCQGTRAATCQAKRLKTIRSELGVLPFYEASRIYQVLSHVIPHSSPVRESYALRFSDEERGHSLVK